VVIAAYRGRGPNNGSAYVRALAVATAAGFAVARAGTG